MLPIRNQWIALIAIILRLTNPVKPAKGVNATNQCTRTFVETFNILYYWRQVTSDEVETILQSQAEGISLRDISRVNKRAYTTVVSIVHAAAYRAQLIHNEEVKEAETGEVLADEMWSFVKKTETLRS